MGGKNQKKEKFSRQSKEMEGESTDGRRKTMEDLIETWNSNKAEN